MKIFEIIETVNLDSFSLHVTAHHGIVFQGNIVYLKLPADALSDLIKLVERSFQETEGTIVGTAFEAPWDNRPSAVISDDALTDKFHYEAKAYKGTHVYVRFLKGSHVIDTALVSRFDWSIFLENSF